MNSDDIDLVELKDRYNYLVERYILLAKELAPKLEEFGRCKKEIEFINEQFAKKSQELVDSEKLMEKYEEDLKSSINKDG